MNGSSPQQECSSINDPGNADQPRPGLRNGVWGGIFRLISLVQYGFCRRRLDGLARLQPFFGLSHEAAPDFGWKVAAGHPVHWGVVIVAHPDAHGEIRREANEPSIP